MQKKNKHFIESKLQWVREPNTEYVHCPSPPSGCDGNINIYDAVEQLYSFLGCRMKRWAMIKKLVMSQRLVGK